MSIEEVQEYVDDNMYQILFECLVSIGNRIENEGTIKKLVDEIGRRLILGKVRVTTSMIKNGLKYG